MNTEENKKGHISAYSGFYREKVYVTRSEEGLIQRNEEAINRVLMMDNAVGIVSGYYDDRFSIVFMSDFFLHHMGYTYDELMEVTGGSFKELVHTDDRAYLESGRFQNKDGERMLHLIQHDGTPMYVRTYKTESSDENGMPMWVMAVRTAEDFQNLELVSDIIRSGGWYIDFNENGTVKKAVWSQQFRSILGFRGTGDFPDELEEWSKRLHPEDKERVLQCLFDAANDKTNETKYIVEYRMMNKSGEYRWYKASAEINRRMDGSPSHMVGIFVDIDKEHKTREENHAMEELLQGIIHLVKQFAVLDFESEQYILHNLDGEKVAKTSGSYGQLVKELVKGYKLLTKEKTLQQVLSIENVRSNLHCASDIYNFEYCSSDEKIFKNMSVLPLEFDGSTLQRALLIIQDVTQVKTSEIEAREALKDAYVTAKRANQAKTEFLSNISHDIRTPMNAIVGMTAIAGAYIDDRERVSDCLAKINQASRHLLSLINEVLDMNQIEHGKFSLVEEEFEIPDLIDDIMVIAKPEAKKHRHHLSLHISDIFHEQVIGDSVRIRQVMINILGNAIKYTPDGGSITFSIEEKTVCKNTVCYEFVIKDNGIGMTKEFQKIIFEPFARADSDRSTKVVGTGLGMPITKNIVSMMNGDIKVESTLGEGSCFTVTLFLKLQEREKTSSRHPVNHPIAVEERQKAGSNSDFGAIEELKKEDYSGKRILLVEDNEINSEIAVEILQMTGVEVECAENGKQAVEMVRGKGERYYDMIFMDIQMPEMNGYDATKEIRRLCDAKKLPIIAMTANAFTEDVILAKSAGMNGHIAKPLHLRNLADIMKKWIKEQEE